MEIINYEVEKLQDPTGILTGERFEYTMAIKVDEEDEHDGAARQTEDTPGESVEQADPVDSLDGPGQVGTEPGDGDVDGSRLRDLALAQFSKKGAVRHSANSLLRLPVFRQ